MRYYFPWTLSAKPAPIRVNIYIQLYSPFLIYRTTLNYTAAAENITNENYAYTNTYKTRWSSYIWPWLYIKFLQHAYNSSSTLQKRLSRLFNTINCYIWHLWSYTWNHYKQPWISLHIREKINAPPLFQTRSFIAASFTAGVICTYICSKTNWKIFVGHRWTVWQYLTHINEKDAKCNTMDFG